MGRKSLIIIMKDILRVLEDGKEHSIKSLSEKVKCRWETARKGLEFLKDINNVVESEDKLSSKKLRLFKIKEVNKDG